MTKAGKYPLTYNGRLQVNEYCPRNVLSSTGFAEERVEGIVGDADGLVGRHLSIGLDAVFQAVELPAGVANLDTSLPNVYRDTLTL